MALSLLASTSYEVVEGTYTVEVLHDGAAQGYDLRLMQKPRRSTSRDDSLYGLVSQELRIRVRDKGRRLTDKILDSAPLWMRISGAYQWTGRLRTPERTQRIDTSAPILDLLFSEGYERELDVPISRLPGGRSKVADFFHELVSPLKGPDTVRMLWEWTHQNMGNGHPARLTRIWTDEVTTGAERESYYDVLSSLLHLWNADLVQGDGAWNVRHRAALDGSSTALVYDGSTYATEPATTVTISDQNTITKINDTDKAPRLKSVEAVNALKSVRIVPGGPEGTPNINNGEQTGSWESVFYNGDSQLRSDQPGSSISDAEDKPYNGLSKSGDGVDLQIDFKVPSTATGTATYTFTVAEVRLVRTPDGTYYADQNGSWQQQAYRHTVSYTVPPDGPDTEDGTGPNDVVISRSVTLTPDSPPVAGLPLLAVYYEYSVDGGSRDIEWLQYETEPGTGRWFFDYDGSVSRTTSRTREHGFGGNEMRISVGDHDEWAPSIVEVYTGSEWVAASPDWSDPSGAVPLHTRRVLDRLRARRELLLGRQSSHPRGTIMDPSRIPVIDAEDHSLALLDGRLGRGASRLNAYPIHPFSASSGDVRTSSKSETIGL